MPRLRGIRLLWLVSRVSQPLFDAACAIPGLEGLYVKWSGVRSLAPVRGCASLKYLHLGGSPGVESLHPISDALQLKVLGLENLKKIRDLSPVASLRNLEELAVEGSTWTTQHVDTLEPLSTLTELRFLSLVNLRAADRTLRPLFSLRKLQGFHAAQWWDPAEMAQLCKLNPALAA